jgi:diacylglycerol kinase family enzyme
MEPRNSTAKSLPAFIVNRNAGRFRRDAGLEAGVRRAVGEAGRVFATSTKGDLAAAVDEALALGAAPVVLCGGDGTYLAGVTALVRAAAGRPLPPIALGRAGTVSIVAKNWGARRDVLSTVRAVVDRPESLSFATRPTLTVESDGDETRVGFTFGTGLVAKFFEEYDRQNPKGLIAAFGIVVRVFADSFNGGGYAEKILSPLPCRVTVDDRELEPAAWSLVLASVLRDVGLHMLVTHRAGEDADRPHLVASPLTPRTLGPQWPLVALGRPLIGRENFDGLVQSFRITFPGKGPYVLDGDTFQATSVTVRAGPRITVVT